MGHRRGGVLLRALPGRLPWMVETEAEFVFAAKAAEAFGMTQVVSPIPRSTARTRAAFATTYALGQLHLVPWDLYMGSDATGSQPRYFGTREQYGDLCDQWRTRGAVPGRPGHAGGGLGQFHRQRQGSVRVCQRAEAVAGFVADADGQGQA
jgi:hypothetical protein